MPSWNGVWISGVAAGNVLAFALILYSWEHAFGLVSAFKRKKAVPEGPPDKDVELSQTNAGSEKAGSEENEKAVKLDVEELSLYPVVISWEDLECKVFTGDATAIKTIIHPCSGTFMPSEFVAIMGPSGAGKSTMLDILAGRKTDQGVKGSVTLNGALINPNLAHRFISYVGQEDVFMPMLTVWESLLFIARLSMPPMPESSRRAQMEKVLSTLGLTRLKDSKVGGLLAGGLDMRGISGGEKRRLSIACGLVANPSLVFLDEPTTGLDSHAALAVMKHLRSLSGLGHTIVSTIHQPRQEIFRSFDKLLVMSEGYMLFLAPTEHVLPWFQEVLGLPYDKAKDGTVADWLLGAIAVNFQNAKDDDTKSMATADHIKAAAERFEKFTAGSATADAFPTSSPAEAPADQRTLVGPATAKLDSDEETDETESKTASMFSELGVSFSNEKAKSGQPTMQKGTSVDSYTSTPLPTADSEYPMLKGESRGPGLQGPAEMQDSLGGPRSAYATRWTNQFIVLLHRFVLQQLRNPTEAGMRLLAASWSGIFFGLVWVRLPNDADSAQERLALIFFTLMMMCMVPFAYMAFPAHDKRFFSLDCARGLYHPSAYFLAYQCANAPFLILNSWATVIVIYGLVGLRYTPAAIIEFNLILGLHALISNQLLVLCIWYFSTQDAAFSVATIYSAFSLLICGFYIRVSEMTLSVMRGLSWASYSKYTFQALAYTELQNRTWDQGPCRAQSAAPGFEQTLPLCYFKPDYLLQYYDFRLPVYKSTLAMLGFYLGMSLMSYWALLRIYKKR